MLKLIRDRRLKQRASKLAEQQKLEEANAALRQRLAQMLGEPVEIKQAA
jgi:primosomal protein N''